MSDKLGTYINRLMTTVVDKENDEFVRELALSELKNLNLKIEEFLHDNKKNDEEESKKTIKTLLQEEKKNG
jgi:hypothetical protein|tara:strand:+ start:181 stop:393 length:213 start_codon:yes stop_codon:yes gene_type:complete